MVQSVLPMKYSGLKSNIAVDIPFRNTNVSMRSYTAIVSRCNEDYSRRQICCMKKGVMHDNAWQCTLKWQCALMLGWEYNFWISSPVWINCMPKRSDRILDTNITSAHVLRIQYSSKVEYLQWTAAIPQSPFKINSYHLYGGRGPIQFILLKCQHWINWLPCVSW